MCDALLFSRCRVCKAYYCKAINISASVYFCINFLLLVEMFLVQSVSDDLEELR